MKKKTVLDERELQEMYRIEHMGLWTMYVLLCVSVVVQLLMGAPFAQMAAELMVIVVAGAMMIIANARHGIWDERARPSVKGNAVYALAAGACVAAIIAVMRRSLIFGLVSGLAFFAMCFLALAVLMAYVRRRQEKEERALDDE